MVLQNHGNIPRDLIHLWSNCRPVSRGFQREVEEFFGARCLPETNVWIFDEGDGESNGNCPRDYRRVQYRRFLKGLGPIDPQDGDGSILDEGYGFSRLLQPKNQEAVFTQGKANNDTGRDIANKKTALQVLAIDPPRKSADRHDGHELAKGFDIRDLQPADLGVKWLPSGELVLDWRILFAQLFCDGGNLFRHPVNVGRGEAIVSSEVRNEDVWLMRLRDSRRRRLSLYVALNSLKDK